MKRFVVFLAGSLLLTAAQAQNPESADCEIMLPPDAQKCVLPASPDAIPENANLDQLKKAKADVKTFQTDVQVFRECLDKAGEDPDLTDCNRQAINDSYNYSVEMEERVAQRFNAAVREYKARKAAGGE